MLQYSKQQEELHGLKDLVKDILKKETRDNQLKCRKVMLIMSLEWNQIFKQFAGAYRFIYNLCVKYDKFFKSTKDKRDAFINDGSLIRMLYPWIKKYPYTILEQGIRDFDKAKKTSLALIKSNQITRFDMKIKKTSHSFSIPHRNWRNGNPFPIIVKNLLGKKLGPIKTKEKIDIKHDTRILYEPSQNKWYIIELKMYSEPIENQNENGYILSLDPGVRTFQTGFSTDGKEIYFGKDFSLKLKEIYIKINKLHSHKDNLHISWKGKSKTRRNIKKSIKKLEFKSKNLVREMHYIIIKYIIQNYDIILLPIFETQDIVKKLCHKGTKRTILGLNHFVFKMRLQFKCKQYKKKLFIVDESYTSQLCRQCNNLTKSSSEIFHCKYCNIKVSRDLNAAKNIMVKNYKIIEDYLKGSA